MGDTISKKEKEDHPKQKLFDLIMKVMKTQNEDLSPAKRNELVESELIQEYIKQDEFLKVLHQINLLGN
jgi:hypothetical protein